MKLTFFFIIVFIILVSCTEKQSGLNDESFLIVKKQVTENYEDSDKKYKETVVYTYDKISDFFWIKAEYRDASGKKIRIITQELDEKTRMPIKGIIEENGIVSESFLVSYSSNNYEILSKDDFIGDLKNGNKSKSVNYDYQDGYLVIKTSTEFFNDSSFIALRGSNVSYKYKIRYFSPRNIKPKGLYDFPHYYEYRQDYCTNPNCKDFGKLEFDEITKFDNNGFPIYHKISGTDCDEQAVEEWYKSEFDGDGKIVKLTGYCSKKMDSANAQNSQFLYEYDGNGFLERVEEYKYNLKENEYDLFYDLKLYEWIIPDLPGRHNFADYNYTNERYCYIKKRHSIYQKKIVKFDDVGEKIIDETTDFYDGNYKTKDFKPKLINKTIYIYDKLEKKGETAVIKKNKKY